MSLLENRILTLDYSQPGTGPLAPIVDNQLSPRSDTYLSINHNIRSKVDNNSLPSINAQDVSSQQYVNNNYVNFTGREQIMPTVVQQINLKGNDVYNNLSIHDAKTTTNETTLYSYSGNAENQTKGQNFYRYEDKPKTTTNETTLYSYSGNAENKNNGQNFYRYEDKPKTTTNETTLYSYSGDANGNVTSFNQMNRVLYTGNKKQVYDEHGNVKNILLDNSGVTSWSQKDITLVKNYFPGPNGHTNIQLDPENKIGLSLLNTDNDHINVLGPGSYSQILPNAENFQEVKKDSIGQVTFNPNKIVDINDRSTANYIINNLQINDYSIYQRPELRGKKQTELGFFRDSNAFDYSGSINTNVPFKKLEEINLNRNLTNVYTNNKFNSNSVITHNTYSQSKNDIENPLLYQTKKKTDNLLYTSKVYK